VISLAAGIIAYALSIGLFFFDLQYGIIPLAIFVLLCMIAPFMPGFSFFLPIISRGKSGKRAVALTFDDGPDPNTTPALLSLLSSHNIKATFFIIGEKADKYPELIKDIIQKGHTIGNHSYHHDTLVMLKSYKKLKREIEDTQNILKKHGIIPLLFRPPVGITNPKLKNALSELNMQAVNFSCRASDFGNRRIKYLSKKILKNVNSDDIIILHDVMPKDSDYWLNEIALIISGIKDMEFDILPLDEIIEQPVMMKE